MSRPATSITPHRTPASKASGSTPDSHSLPASSQLQRQLGQLRRHLFLVSTGHGISIAALVGIELLAVLMLTDWWFNFSWHLRLALFLGQLLILQFFLYRYVLRPLFQPPNDEDLALRVERAHPEFRSRLISSVQFAQPGALSPHASLALAQSTVEQTEAIAAPIHFPSIVSTQKLKRLAAAASVVLMLAGIALYASREVSIDLLRRAFLANIPVPRKTHIDFVTGNATIGRGDNIRLEAMAHGIIPQGGQLVVKSQGRRDVRYPMDPTPEQASKFMRTLESVQERFEYEVRLNDAISPTYVIEVIPRPTIQGIECEQVPPPYTSLPARRRAPGDLTLLIGSTLRLKAIATKDLQSAQLRLSGIPQTLPLTINPQNPREITGEIPLMTNRINGFSFELADVQTMSSPQGTVYRIDVLPDKVPTVRMTYPERKEELLTRLATLVIGLEASDDFALSKILIKYKVSTIDNGAEKQMELDLKEPATGKIKRRFDWKLAQFQPPLQEGSLIEFWVEATDNNNVTGPGVGTSEHQLARIVSDNEKRADLLNRAGDSLNALGEVTSEQEKLNRSLGTIILEKTGAK